MCTATRRRRWACGNSDQDWDWLSSCRDHSECRQRSCLAYLCTPEQRHPAIPPSSHESALGAEFDAFVAWLNGIVHLTVQEVQSKAKLRWVTATCTELRWG
jgi:hypothetical protein